MKSKYFLINDDGDQVDLNNAEVIVIEVGDRLDILVKCDVLDEQYPWLKKRVKFSYCSPDRSVITVYKKKLSAKQEYLFKHTEIHFCTDPI